jgi:hypothetical protein
MAIDESTTNISTFLDSFLKELNDSIRLQNRKIICKKSQATDNPNTEPHKDTGADHTNM